MTVKKIASTWEVVEGKAKNGVAGQRDGKKGKPSPGEEQKDQEKTNPVMRNQGAGERSKHEKANREDRGQRRPLRPNEKNGKTEQDENDVKVYRRFQQQRREREKIHRPRR